MQDDNLNNKCNNMQNMFITSFQHHIINYDQLIISKKHRFFYTPNFQNSQLPGYLAEKKGKYRGNTRHPKVSNTKESLKSEFYRMSNDQSN